MNEGSPELTLTPLSFEEAFDELEAVVQQLEGGNLPLEEAITLYERGMKLARRCSEALDAAALRVQQLAVVEGQPQPGPLFEDETLD